MDRAADAIAVVYADLMAALRAWAVSVSARLFRATGMEHGAVMSDVGENVITHPSCVHRFLVM